MYQLTETDAVVRLDDNAWIPNDSGNRDRIEYEVWLTNGGVPDPYVPEPDPVPASISDRQFFQQLAVLSIITQDEALASNAAVIPPPLLAIVDQMPEGDRFGAKMLLSGATVFERSHPMTSVIGSAYGWTSEQIDNFFREASLL